MNVVASILLTLHLGYPVAIPSPCCPMTVMAVRLVPVVLLVARPAPPPAAAMPTPTTWRI